MSMPMRAANAVDQCKGWSNQAIYIGGAWGSSMGVFVTILVMNMASMTTPLPWGVSLQKGVTTLFLRALYLGQIVELSLQS